MPYVVGLTGGIGSGKSTVAEQFRRLGADVISADQLARDVVEPGSPALARIKDHFGPNMVTVGGALDRSALRERIFDDSNARKWLENLLHPLIGELRDELIHKSQAPYVLVEIPLLLEKSLHSTVDRILVVDIPTEIQIKRTGQRDSVSVDEVQSIMDTQVSREERLAAADDLIDNSESQDELYEQVTRLHKNYLAEAKEKSKNSR